MRWETQPNPATAQLGFGVFFACRQHLRSHLEMCVSFWGEGFVPLGLMLPLQQV